MPWPGGLAAAVSKRHQCSRYEPWDHLQGPRRARDAANWRPATLGSDGNSRGRTTAGRAHLDEGGSRGVRPGFGAVQRRVESVRPAASKGRSHRAGLRTPRPRADRGGGRARSSFPGEEGRSLPPCPCERRCNRRDGFPNPKVALRFESTPRGFWNCTPWPTRSLTATRPLAWFGRAPPGGLRWRVPVLSPFLHSWCWFARSRSGTHTLGACPTTSAALPSSREQARGLSSSTAL